MGFWKIFQIVLPHLVRLFNDVIDNWNGPEVSTLHPEHFSVIVRHVVLKTQQYINMLDEEDVGWADLSFKLEHLHEIEKKLYGSVGRYTYMLMLVSFPSWSRSPRQEEYSRLVTKETNRIILTSKITIPRNNLSNFHLCCSDPDWSIIYGVTSYIRVWFFSNIIGDITLRLPIEVAIWVGETLPETSLIRLKDTHWHTDSCMTVFKIYETVRGEIGGYSSLAKLMEILLGNSKAFQQSAQGITYIRTVEKALHDSCLYADAHCLFIMSRLLYNVERIYKKLEFRYGDNYTRSGFNCGDVSIYDQSRSFVDSYLTHKSLDIYLENLYTLNTWLTIYPIMTQLEKHLTPDSGMPEDKPCHNTNPV